MMGGRRMRGRPDLEWVLRERRHDDGERVVAVKSFVAHWFSPLLPVSICHVGWDCVIRRGWLWLLRNIKMARRPFGIAEKPLREITSSERLG